MFKFLLFTYLPRFILRPTLLAIDSFWRKVFHSQSDEELLLDEAISQRNVNSREIYFFEFGLARQNSTVRDYLIVEFQVYWLING